MLPCGALLLDLDGTLIDSIELIVRSFQHATAVHLGREWAREEIVPTIGRSLIDALEEIAPGRGQELLGTYREYNLARHDEYVSVYPGVLTMIAEVRARGVPMGIVTSKARVSVAPAFRAFGLDVGMQTVVLLEDTTRHKPHPEPLLLAAERMSVDPADCWYLGDSTHDLQAARAAGMTGIGAAWGPYPRAALAPLAHAIAATPGEVVMLIDTTQD